MTVFHLNNFHLYCSGYLKLNESCEYLVPYSYIVCGLQEKLWIRFLTYYLVVGGYWII